MRNRTGKPKSLQRPLPFLGWMNFLGPETSLVSLKMQKDEVLCLKFGAKLVAAVSSWETIYIILHYGFNISTL